MNSRIAIILILSTLMPALADASNGVAGFQRVTGLPADDVRDWGDPNRFQDINLEACRRHFREFLSECL